jgi:fatty-acyl-CoA synthase
VRLDGPPAPPARHATLAAALRATAGHASGVTFVDLREREEKLAWGEVHARARRAAARLDRWGVRPGDRVAIVLRTEPAFLDAFFGAWLAGAVPVPLYPPVRLGRMAEYVDGTARMLRSCGASLVLSGGGTRRLLGEAVALAGVPLGCRDAEELLGAAEELERPAGPDDLALVQYSSGSTVAPKPVALTHRALQAQADALVALTGPTAADVLVSWLPLYHDMGLIGSLLGAMGYPGPLVLLAPEHFLARPALWLRALSRHRGTLSAAPSFAYGYCAERVRDEELEGCDLRAWRLALDGAEPVAGDPLRRFASRFAPFGLDPGALVPVYGLSEAALAVTFSAPGRPLAGRRVDPVRLALEGRVVEGSRELFSVGRPVPGVSVELRDERGAPTPEAALGRIWVRGPSLMRGYLGDPEGTARALVDGWLDTGDLGFVLDGELHVHGRAKDVVIVRGANRAPEEFEQALDGLPGLRPGCAVAVGAPAGESGAEELIVLAERARGAERDDARLAEAVSVRLRERTGIAPGQVLLLDPGALPRTSSGKLRRGEALRRHLAGTLAAPRGSPLLAVAAAAARAGLASLRSRWRGR